MTSSHNEREKEDRYVRHMTNDPFWRSDIARMKGGDKRIVIGSREIIRRHGNRLICPKCETGAYRYGAPDRARCNKCGWEGRSVTVDEYLTQKLWR